MSVREYMILGEPVGRYEIDLLESAGKLAGNAKGSGDLYGDSPERIRQALRARLNDWDESAEWCRDYDNAVKALCEAALALDAWRTESDAAVMANEPRKK